MKKLFLLIVVALGASLAWYGLSLRPVDTDADTHTPVTVQSGWSTSRIADELETQGVIRSSLAFRLFVRLHGDDGSLQAGKFVIRSSLSVAEIVDILHLGKGQELSVTIPEGFTVTDIDHLLARKGLIQTGALLSCAQTCDFSTFDFLPDSEGLAERGGKLEGYLFPDTYFVQTDGLVPKFFLERMLGAFRTNVVEGFSGDILISERSLHELVTMASLIEEETHTDEERSIVSGILWKRLDDGRGLGVDATVRYILHKPSADITQGDLNVNSPYNTRKFRGLPPGPIANSGIKSIRAALQPEDSLYWYYLHDKKGVIHYAETNEEHNINRYNYLGSGSRD